MSALQSTQNRLCIAVSCGWPIIKGLNVESLLQSATANTSAKCTPLVKAIEVDAPLTEWAEKTLVSTPASFRVSLTQ